MAKPDRPAIVSPPAATATKPSADNPSTSPKRGKTRMTPEQKAARMEALKNESKNDKWKRLYTQRMPKALSALRQLGHLANKSAYEWTQEQQNKLINTLEAAVKSIKDKFAGSQENGDSWRL